MRNEVSKGRLWHSPLGSGMGLWRYVAQVHGTVQKNIFFHSDLYTCHYFIFTRNFFLHLVHCWSGVVPVPCRWRKQMSLSLTAPAMALCYHPWVRDPSGRGFVLGARRVKQSVAQHWTSCARGQECTSKSCTASKAQVSLPPLLISARFLFKYLTS